MTLDFLPKMKVKNGVTLAQLCMGQHIKEDADYKMDILISITVIVYQIRH